MIEDELNYPDTMKKQIYTQEYRKWADETELGRAYNTYRLRYQPQHVYCYPSTSEPPAVFLCIGQCRNNYFYVKRNKHG